MTRHNARVATEGGRERSDSWAFQLMDRAYCLGRSFDDLIGDPYHFERRAVSPEPPEDVQILIDQASDAIHDLYQAAGRWWGSPEDATEGGLERSDHEEPVREPVVGDVYEEPNVYRWLVLDFDDDGCPVTINRLCERTAWTKGYLEQEFHLLAHTTDLTEAMAWLRNER